MLQLIPKSIKKNWQMRRYSLELKDTCKCISPKSNNVCSQVFCAPGLKIDIHSTRKNSYPVSLFKSLITTSSILQNKDSVVHWKEDIKEGIKLLTFNEDERRLLINTVDPKYFPDDLYNFRVLFEKEIFKDQYFVRNIMICPYISPIDKMKILESKNLRMDLNTLSISHKFIYVEHEFSNYLLEIEKENSYKDDIVFQQNMKYLLDRKRFDSLGSKNKLKSIHLDLNNYSNNNIKKKKKKPTFSREMNSIMKANMDEKMDLLKKHIEKEDESEANSFFKWMRNIYIAGFFILQMIKDVFYVIIVIMFYVFILKIIFGQ